MDDRKKRVEAFIASHLDAKIESGALVIGGMGQSPISPLATTNNNNCKNPDSLTCSGSINGGDCQNAKSMCNNSRNDGDCDNNYILMPANQTLEGCN